MLGFSTAATSCCFQMAARQK